MRPPWMSSPRPSCACWAFPVPKPPASSPSRSLPLTPGNSPRRCCRTPVHAPVPGSRTRDEPVHATAVTLWLAAPLLDTEPGAGHLLCDPGAVQVGRDPAEMEGPAGAQDHAQVDVLGRRDDTLVEHQPDLLRQRLQGALANLPGGRRAVA